MTRSGVLVVGAGPAGSVAALVLARAGVPVRLVDRAAFPRPKLCGDTVNPGTLALLDALGVGDCIRSRGRPLSGMLVTGPDGPAVAADYPGGMCAIAIERRELDLALLDAAVAAGADFTPGVHTVAPLFDRVRSRVTGVRIQAGGRESDLGARVVIAADGRGSRLGSALHLTRFAPRPRRWAFGAYFTDVDGLTPRGEMHIRPDGYIGVAPLGQGVANVCLVRQLRRGATAGGTCADAALSDAIDGSAALRGRFTRARRISGAVALGPLAVDATAAGCSGLLLAGDAAGFVDPMTGDGLRFAVRGGELAADAALIELETGVPAHHTLHAARRREFAGKWRLNRALRALTGSSQGVALAATLASFWSGPVAYLIGLAGDVGVARRARLHAAPGGP